MSHKFITCFLVSVVLTCTHGQPTLDADETCSRENGKLDTLVSLMVEMSKELKEVRQELTSVKSELETLKTESNNVKTELLEELRPPYGYQKARVFHAQSPLGSHKLTYEEGVAMCQSMGAVIATKAQLTTALHLGMSMCSCGWVEEGDSYYPIIWTRPHCGGKYTSGPFIAGPCTASITWNVYCFK